MTNPNENTGQVVANDEKTPQGMKNAVAVNDERVVSIPVVEVATLTQLVKDGADPNGIKILAETMLLLRNNAMSEAFNLVLQKAIKDIPPLKKNKKASIPIRNSDKNMEYGYITLEALQKHVRPHLDRYGITLTIDLGSEGNMITAQPTFLHNGHKEVMGVLPVPADTGGSKSPAQAVGSTATFATKFGICAALGIILEGYDDDGALAKPEPKEPTPSQKKMLIAAWKAAELGMASLTEYMGNLQTNNPKDALFLSKHLSKDGKPYYGKLVEQANAFDDKGGNDNAS